LSKTLLEISYNFLFLFCRHLVFSYRIPEFISTGIKKVLVPAQGLNRNLCFSPLPRQAFSVLILRIYHRNPLSQVEIKPSNIQLKDYYTTTMLV